MEMSSPQARQLAICIITAGLFVGVPGKRKLKCTVVCGSVLGQVFAQAESGLRHHPATTVLL